MTATDDELVLELTIAQLKEFGEWPKLEVIHRKIHQELGVDVKVQDVARRLAPKPFVGRGYSYLGETFNPPLDVIARVHEGRELVQGVVAFINFARTKYQASQGQPEITSREFMEQVGIDEATARAVRELLVWVPDSTDGGYSNADGWAVTVADEIVSWPELKKVDDLFAHLERRYQERESQAATIQDAKFRLLQATGHVHPAEEQEGHARWIDRPLARTMVWVATVLGGIAAGVFIWTWVR